MAGGARDEPEFGIISKKLESVLGGVNNSLHFGAFFWLVVRAFPFFGLHPAREADLTS